MKISCNLISPAGVVLFLTVCLGIGVAANPANSVRTAGAWPVAPRSDASVIAPGIRKVPSPFVTFGTAQPGPPRLDPLQKFTPGPMRGTLAYITLIAYPDKPEAQSFFVFHAAGSSPRVNNIATSAVTYPLNAWGQAFEPQFSPSGNRILFKCGTAWGGRSVFYLFLWDFKAGRVSQILVPKTESLSFRRVSWSPDGRQIAYVTGGDADGYEDRWTDLMRLNVHNLVTGKNRFIAQNTGVKHFAWTPQGTLLYTFAPPYTYKYISPAPGSNTYQPVHLRLYEALMDGRLPHKITMDVADQGNPVPSPDGKQIAFLGWQKAGAGNVLNRRFGIWLYRRSDHSRRLLWALPFQSSAVAEGTVPDLLWTPDSRNLIVVAKTYTAEHPNAKTRLLKGKGLGKAIIWRVAVGRSRKARQKLATLTAQDAWADSRGDLDTQFSPLTITRSGQKLLLNVSEYVSGSTSGFIEDRRLLSVDLKNGRKSMIARLLNKWNEVPGWGWREDPLPSVRRKKSD